MVLHTVAVALLALGVAGCVTAASAVGDAGAGGSSTADAGIDADAGADADASAPPPPPPDFCNLPLPVPVGAVVCDDGSFEATGDSLVMSWKTCKDEGGNVYDTRCSFAPFTAGPGYCGCAYNGKGVCGCNQACGFDPTCCPSPWGSPPVPNSFVCK